MAKISRDTFDETKNYQTVIHQFGVPVVDNEINEAQKIAMAHRSEGLSVAMSVLRAIQSSAGTNGGLRYGFASGDAWAPVGGIISPTISITAGDLYVDGFRVVLPSAEVITLASTVAADTYGLVYVDIVMDEVDSTEDPDIAQSKIGETTQRQALSVAFNTVESLVSFEAAFNAIVPQGVDASARIWKNNVARIFLCRYLRPALSGNILSEYIVDMRQTVPAELPIQQPFIKTVRPNTSVAAEGTTTSDGMITWNMDNSRLQIGVTTSQATVDALENGLTIRRAGAPDHFVQQPTAIVFAQNGAGNADGTARVPDNAKGWSIPDGSALGYLPQGSATNRKPFVPRKIHSTAITRPVLYDLDTNPPSFTPNALLVQKLSVATIDSFLGDPAAWILCTRKGNDLIWYNGIVTRGQVGVNVFEELGGTPSQWDVVVGAHGKNHVSLSDGVERALNYSTTGAGASTFGSSRSLRMFIRRGDWLFARAVKKYGTTADYAAQGTAYDTDNSVLEMVGDSPGTTRLTFSNPESAARASADIAVVTFMGGDMVFKNLTFNQNGADATFKPSYYYFETDKSVVFENCHFIGPVWVKAQSVLFKNCTFFAFGNSGYNLFPSAIVGQGVVPQHLKLQVYSNSVPSSHVVEGCTFNVGTSDGTQCSLHLRYTSTPLGRCKINDNIWKYNSGGKVPAIHFGLQTSGVTCNVEIGNNLFLDATGVVKEGQTAVDSFTTEGYLGTPMARGPLGTEQTYCLSYISIPCSLQGLTNIHHNYFDMAIGTGLSDRYIVWAACLIMFNSATLANQQVGNFDNITYDGNTHEMSTGVAFGAGGAEPQIWSTGIFIGPCFDGDATNLLQVHVRNVRIVNTHFDLGGPTAATTTQAYRSINQANINSWPVAGGFMMESSCLIGMQLKSGAFATYGGGDRARVLVKDLEISGNKISQNQINSFIDPVLDQIALSDSAAYPGWWFNGIWLDAGGQPPASVSLTVTEIGAAATLGAVGSAGRPFFAPLICNNRIEAPMYFDGAAVTDGTAAIVLIGCYEAIVANNQIYMTTTVGSDMNGILVYAGNKRTLVTGNIVKAQVGVRGVALNYLSNNMLHGCPTTEAGAWDNDYDAGSENFLT